MEWLTFLQPGEEYYLQVSVEASVKKSANSAVGVSKMNNNNINNMNKLIWIIWTCVDPYYEPHCGSWYIKSKQTSWYLNSNYEFKKGVEIDCCYKN